MKTIMKLWLIAGLLMVIAVSCKESEDVRDTSGYYYYLSIQSQVRLHLSEDAEDENGMATNTEMDRLARTIFHMQQAVVDNKNMKKDNRAQEAALFSTLDSLYRNYADMNPANKGQVICYVKLMRCSLFPNGNVKDSQAIKYYSFWWEDPYSGSVNGGGNDSTAMNYFAKPDTLQAVDLGLSVLWANCNLGAKEPRSYGARVAWGDPTGMLFSAQGIGWNDNGYTWNTNNYGGNNPPADIAETELDVVAHYWGDGWHIPSYSEAKELCEQCRWELRSQGDLRWYEVIGPNGNSIIMPLAGILGDDLASSSKRFQIGPYLVNQMGYYWTSTSCPTPSSAEERGYGVNDGVVTAWFFSFYNDNDNPSPQFWFNDYVRGYHMSVRPVLNK